MPIDPAVSKAVGLDYRVVSWPSSVAAVYAASEYQILEWNRFLPSPQTPLQIQIIGAIVERLA